jgi:hypothetical protein
MPETQAKKNPLEEYLKLNPNAYQDYQSIQEWFKQNSGVGTIVHDMIMWHRGLINSLLKPFRTLFEELLKKPGNLTDKKEYSEVKKKFLEIAKESFKKDDKGKEMWHDDKVANYLTWAATFLACAEGDFEMFKQEQEKSYKLSILILMKYTCLLMMVINKNTRDDAGISDVFRKQTEATAKWVDIIHPASIQAIWGL